MTLGGPSTPSAPPLRCATESSVTASRSQAVPILRDAAIVVAVATALALVSNTVRKGRIAIVQREPYAILVPCPEPVGDAAPITPTDPRVSASSTLILDVRSAEDFAAWHVPNAKNQPFDWLGPPVDDEVKKVARDVAASRAQQVVVYGDGDDPDSGREWARLLSGARIKNVSYVEGGGPAIHPSPKPPEPEEP